MKKLPLAFLILLLPFLIFAQWEQQTSGTNEYLRSIFFTDSLNGWAVGSGGIILHTDNGGVNWVEQAIITNSSYSGVHFTNINHGWVVGRKTTFPFFGEVQRTIDGGISWEEVILPPVLSRLCGVYFRDILDGWLVGGGIYHTIDGGETWESQSFASCEAGGIYFSDSLNGWMVGSNMNGSTGYIDSFILHTNDGGNSWNFQFNEHSRDVPTFFSVYFTDSLKGWVAGGYPNLFEIILKTTDGGDNWDTSYLSNSGSLNSIYFIDTFNGWAVGAYGNILYTSDAGISWESIPSGTDNTLKSIYFTENGYGWAVGGDGTILHADYSQIVGLNGFELKSSKFKVECYPNPFTTSTTIEYTLNSHQTVTITFFNQFGKQVDRIELKQTAGKQQITWNAEGLQAGIYYFKIDAYERVASGKVVLMR